MALSACTIVARNYLAAARVLHASFAAHHPGWGFHVLIVDDEARAVADEEEPFTVLRLGALGLAAEEIAVLAAIYDVTELATAVKPRLLRYLRERAGGVVVYLDPDIKVFGPFDEAVAAAGEHAIVLTPHTTTPLPRDRRQIASAQILASGVYNLGFIAVGDGGDPFLDWWWQQTRRDALSDPLRMMFTDQRWMDLAPCLFDHALLKHPGYNVAYWNLHGRAVAAVPDGYRANGEPLKFFHFSGFDPRRPHLLSHHQRPTPRILLSEHPVVAALCRDYAADLARHEGGATRDLPYGWGEVQGLRITAGMRRLYWRAVVEAEEKGAALPPGPFDPAGPAAFLAWLNERRLPAARPVISRYLLDYYERRPDLQRAFPDLAGADGVRFLEWALRDGVQQDEMPEALWPTPRDVERARAPLFVHPDDTTPGVNLAGYFFAELGVGEAARLVSAALAAGGVPCETLAYDATLSRQEHAYELAGAGRAAHDVNVICVNADALPRFRATFGTGLFEGRYTIGYWFWEVDDFPPAMWEALGLVDEVWTASAFVAEAIRRVSPRPVHCLPHPLLAPEVPADVTRADLGVPEGFAFLFVFDYLSVFERKNPCAVVEAFTRAFAPGEGPVLVLKSINGERRLADRELLLAAIAGRRDIVLLEDYLSGAHRSALMQACDCYVSLHRAEGLGLTLAEAMALGKPAIATGYSGNLDFMTAENSYLVDHRLVPVPAGCDPYPAGAEWAQPDVAHAAALMRRVYLDQHAARERGQRARADILARHTAAVRGAAMAERLAAIRAERAAGDAARTAATRHAWDTLLTRAEEHLPPGPSVLGGGLSGALRRLLVHVLRPYWFPQRVLQEALIEALRGSDRRVAHDLLEVRQRQAAADGRLEQRLEQIAARLDRLESQRPAADELRAELRIVESENRRIVVNR